MGAGRHAPIAGEDQAYVIAALLENPEPHDRKIYPLVGPVEMSQDDIAEAIGRTLGCEYPDELYASEIADLVTQFLGCRVDRHTQQLKRVAAFPYRLCSRDAEHAKGFHSTVFGLRDDGAALVAWRIRC